MTVTTNTPRKLSTVAGGLSGLRSLVLGAKRANRTISEHREATSNPRNARWGKVGAGAKRCICCGAKVSRSAAATVLFKVVNGPTGSVVGRVCQAHKSGESMRQGTSTIKAILRKDTPKVINTVPSEPAKVAETYTSHSYACAKGVSISTAGKHLLKAFRAGSMTRAKVAGRFVYTVA